MLAASLGLSLAPTANPQIAPFDIGIDREPGPKRNRRWCQLYRAGWTLDEIGKAYGVSGERVRSVLKRLRVARRPPGGARR